MIDEKHNHQSTLTEAHSVLRRMTLTDEIKKNISRQLSVQTVSSKILSTLRIDDDVSNSMIKSRDIYNLKTKMQREVLESLTSIQALIKKLDEEH
jgi:C4-type Zn-finger protein